MANNSHSGTPTYTTDSIIGDYNVLTEGSSIQQLKKYLEPYSKDELVSLVMSVASNEEIVCQTMLNKIQTDKKWCKLFVHGLAFSTSKEQLEKHYKHYGKVKEAVVLVDKKGNSKGYGFVTFANAKSALEAAKDPKKRIDNRVTHCNLAFKGNPKKFAMQNGGNGNALSPKQRENANDRRLFVHSLAWKTTDDSLADVFREYGELQEAVVIRDKKTNKSKGYGFVTFKYSESAQQALADPNKKIDGRQTHCNYACERSNINGNDTINSPNSTIGSTPNNVNNHSNPRNNDPTHRSQQSIQSLTSPSMGLNNSNLSMQSSNSGHPQMSTFSSNPLTLQQNLSLGGSNRINSNSIHSNLHNNIHNSSQLGTGIDISSLQSIPTYQNTINLPMPGATSQRQQRPMGIPSYAPTGSAYGANTNQSPYGHPPPPSHQHTNHNSVHNQRPHDSISHLISPNGNHQDPMSLLRNLGSAAGPNSPIPSSVLSINGLAGTQQMGLSSMIMRNPQTQGGGNSNGFPGSHPSNLNLGHSQNPSTTQNQSQSQTGIVVSGVNINNTFTSQQSMPRHQPPATPPYAHVQTTNKENLPTNSPYYGSNSQLAIPGFKPQQVGTLGTIGTMPQSSKKIIATNTNQHQQQQQQPMMNLTPQQIQQKTQQLQQQIGVQLNMSNNTSNNMRNNGNNNPNNTNNNIVNNNNVNNMNHNNSNNNNIAQQINSIKAKIPPLNVKNVQNVPQHQDEGNLSPQSQVDSDDEGDKE